MYSDDFFPHPPHEEKIAHHGYRGKFLYFFNFGVPDVCNHTFMLHTHTLLTPKEKQDMQDFFDAQHLNYCDEQHD